MSLLLHIFAAWCLIDLIFVAFWIRRAAMLRETLEDDAEQSAFLDAWEARHA